MNIWMNVDEINGYVKYGHLEGEVDFSEEEEKDFQILLKKENNGEELTEKEQERLKNYKTDIKNSCSLVVDECRINYWDGIEWRNLL